MNTLEKLSDLVADELCVDRDEVTPQARLIEDLGADSLDTLSLTFRIEEKFGVQLKREEVFPDFLFYRGTEFVTTDGNLTDAGREKARETFPGLSREGLCGIHHPSSLLTVRLLADVIDRKLATQAVAA